VNATIQKGAAGYGTPLGNYSPAASSSAVNAVRIGRAPALDFYETRARRTTTSFDIGAVEVPGQFRHYLSQRRRQASGGLFGNVRVGAATTQPVTVANPGTTPLVINGLAVGSPGPTRTNSR